MKNQKKLLTKDMEFIPDLFDLLVDTSDETLMTKIVSLFIEILGTIQTRKYLMPYLKGNYLIPLMNRK